MDRNGAAIAARDSAMARLVELPAEIEAAYAAVDGAAESGPGGSSRTKTFHQRSNAALHRTALACDRVRALELEQKVLTSRVARLQDLPERPPATAELLCGAASIRVFDGLHLGGWTAVVRVNKTSVTIGGGFRIAMGKVVDWC